MEIYFIYWIGLIFPIIAMYIHLERKHSDVELSDLLAMFTVACVPVVRECVLIWRWYETKEEVSIIFKRYK